MASPLLSIIIVSFNTAALTLDCLESIAQEARALSSNWSPADLEVIVIDNASQDRTIAAIQKKRPSLPMTVRTITLTYNLGFGRANNHAATHAHGKVLWFLNSDTRLQPQCLTRVLDQSRTLGWFDGRQGHKQKPQNWGAFATTLLNTDGTAQRQGGDLPSLLSIIGQYWFMHHLPVIGRWWPSTQSAGPDPYARWVSAASLIVPRQYFEKVGGFHKTIFLYGEDVELCLRLHKAGWRVAELSSAAVVHLVSASSSSTRAIVGEVQGYLKIWKLHFPIWQLLVIRLVMGSGLLLRAVIFGTMKKRQRAQASWQACGVAFRGSAEDTHEAVVT